MPTVSSAKLTTIQLAIDSSLLKQFDALRTLKSLTRHESIEQAIRLLIAHSGTDVGQDDLGISEP